MHDPLKETLGALRPAHDDVPNGVTLAASDEGVEPRSVSSLEKAAMAAFSENPPPRKHPNPHDGGPVRLLPPVHQLVVIDATTAPESPVSDEEEFLDGYAHLSQPQHKRAKVVRKPVVRKPVVRKPVVRKPVVRKPVVRKPVNKNTTTTTTTTATSSHATDSRTTIARSLPTTAGSLNPRPKTAQNPHNKTLPAQRAATRSGPAPPPGPYKPPPHTLPQPNVPPSAMTHLVAPPLFFGNAAVVNGAGVQLPVLGDGLKQALTTAFEYRVNAVFRWSRTPSDTEHAIENKWFPLTAIPRAQRMLLEACRFVEMALGTQVDGDVGTDEVGVGLIRLVTMVFLRECSSAITASPFLAKLYYMLGYFHQVRGDLARFHKYRRYALTTLCFCVPNEATKQMKAAISLNDSWAYAVARGVETRLGDEVRPSDPFCRKAKLMRDNIDQAATRHMFGMLPITASCDPTCLDRESHCFLQGFPECANDAKAGFYARAMDAYACAVRLFTDRMAQREGVADASGLGVPVGAGDKAVTSRDIKQQGGELNMQSVGLLVKLAHDFLVNDQLKTGLASKELRTMIEAFEVVLLFEIAKEVELAKRIAFAAVRAKGIHISSSNEVVETDRINVLRAEMDAEAKMLVVAHAYISNPRLLVLGGGNVMPTLLHGLLLSSLQKVLRQQHRKEVVEKDKKPDDATLQKVRSFKHAYCQMREVLSEFNSRLHPFVKCPQSEALPLDDEGILKLRPAPFPGGGHNHGEQIETIEFCPDSFGLEPDDWLFDLNEY